MFFQKNYENFIQIEKENLENCIKNDSFDNIYSFQESLNSFQEKFEVCILNLNKKFFKKNREMPLSVNSNQILFHNVL